MAKDVVQYSVVPGSSSRLIPPLSGAGSFWAPLFSGRGHRWSPASALCSSGSRVGAREQPRRFYDTRLLIALVYHALDRFELTGEARWARLAVRLIDLAEDYELEEVAPDN